MLFVMKYKHIIHVLFDIINIETAMLNETHTENENSFQLIFWAYSSCILCSIVNFNATVHSILCRAINKTKLKGYE